MRFVRYHGLGNDYLVLTSGEPLRPDLVRQLCDRHHGVGSDGILAPADRGPGDHGVTIWNPDGSVAEKSGNGLRIFARWLSEERGAAETFRIWTGSDLVGCEVGSDQVMIEMGRARFEPEAIPLRADLWPLQDAPPAEIIPVGLGNPHCVLLTEEELDSQPWQQWGRWLETHPAFPRRTNVQLARVTRPGVAEARIWERGAGETMASGSSACAVAAAAVYAGRLQAGWTTVSMPGGSLRVLIRPDWTVRLEGPVERVATISVDTGWLQRRQAAAPS